jgi:hypothetical protein
MNQPTTDRRATAGPRLRRAVVALGLTAWAGSASVALAADTSASRQLERFSQMAGTPASAERGRSFFVSRHGGEWACASCHGHPPTAPGRHESTGKSIAPLAPAFNPKAFTDTAKVDKWFRRNCNDVARRECTPAEKADVLAYLTSLSR